MTSRLRKKRPTIARTYNQATRLSLSLLLAASTVSALGQTPNVYPRQQFHGQQYQTTTAGTVALRPVPREGARIANRPAQTNPQREGWNLKWRRSSNAPPPHRNATGSSSQFAAASAPESRSMPAANTQVALPQEGRLRVATDEPNLRPVSQVAWLTPPQPNQAPTSPAEMRLTQTQSTIPNYFSDPFGDDRPPAGNPSNPVTNPQNEMLFPPPGERTADPALRSESTPMNDLRGTIDQRNEPAPTPPGSDRPEMSMPSPTAPLPQAIPSPSTQPQLTPPPSPRPDDGPSFGEMLRENKPEEGLPRSLRDSSELLPAPGRGQADRDFQDSNAELDRPDDDQLDNPFDRLRNQDADKADRDRLNSETLQDVGPDDRDDRVGRYDDDRKDLSTDFGISCTDFRQRIAEQTIDQVSLDISPPYRPDEIDTKRYQELKADFDEKQPIRQWRSVDGRQIASGRLRDLAYEKAVIETESGSTEELTVSRLSEADLAYIAENWGLPRECLLEQVAFTPRTWTPLTMTWRASNLCHTPLYFEDVNLERYGHTHGPVLEPIVQSAHFFANVAVLPYKMGVHSPKECQYALGYYRPGNCAPWIVPPVPLSARGALAQGAAMTGLFWLIP